MDYGKSVTAHGRIENRKMFDYTTYRFIYAGYRNPPGIHRPAAKQPVASRALPIITEIESRYLRVATCWWYASWGDVPVFGLTVTGQKFNPDIVIPELPGSLTFSSHLQGKLDPKAL